MRNIEIEEFDDLTIGDHLTLTRWVNNTDQSYIGDLLVVTGLSFPYVFVDEYSKYSGVKNLCGSNQLDFRRVRFTYVDENFIMGMKGIQGKDTVPHQVRILRDQVHELKEKVKTAEKQNSLFSEEINELHNKLKSQQEVVSSEEAYKKIVKDVQELRSFYSKTFKYTRNNLQFAHISNMIECIWHDVNKYLTPKEEPQWPQRGDTYWFYNFTIEKYAMNTYCTTAHLKEIVSTNPYGIFKSRKDLETFLNVQNRYKQLSAVDPVEWDNDNQVKGILAQNTAKGEIIFYSRQQYLQSAGTHYMTEKVADTLALNFSYEELSVWVQGGKHSI